MGRQAAAHGERLVHTDEPLDPGIDQQVVANAYLNRRLIAGINQQYVQESRVEHYVAVVGDKGEALVALPFRQQVMAEGASIRMLADDVVHDGLHKPLLEVQRRLHALKCQAQCAIAQQLGQPRSEALHHHVKLAVANQLLERLLHLFRLIRPDFVERPTQALPRGGVFCYII